MMTTDELLVRLNSDTQPEVVRQYLSEVVTRIQYLQQLPGHDAKEIQRLNEAGQAAYNNLKEKNPDEVMPSPAVDVTPAPVKTPQTPTAAVTTAPSKATASSVEATQPGRPVAPKPSK